MQRVCDKAIYAQMFFHCFSVPPLALEQCDWRHPVYPKGRLVAIASETRVLLPYRHVSVLSKCDVEKLERG